jgi:hypothetical protein
MNKNFVWGDIIFEKKKTKPMTMKKLIFALVIICTIIGICTLMSCRNQQVVPTVTQRIIGKWTMKTAIGNYTEQGNNRKDTTRFTAADYFNFKADGTLEILESNVPHNGNWVVTNNKLYITNTHYIDYTNGFDLPILTSTNMQLYYTESTNITSLEQKLNFAK